LKLVIDAGGLLAIERNDRAMWRRLKNAAERRIDLVTHSGVVGQVWRGRGSRQAVLAQALAAIEVRPLDEALGRRAGELMAMTRQRDVVDAALVLLAQDDDQILTSDPGDLEPLAAAADLHVELVPV
jgi:hypothetical protein